ncbi:hypothetical protein ACOSQ4_027171 [Xanthoceras sorbifolium]
MICVKIKKGWSHFIGGFTPKKGIEPKKYAENANRVREVKGQTREGCPAAMRFVTEHSQILSKPKHTQLLRSHRIVKESDMSVVMDHMVDMTSGYASVGHTKKDLQNIIDVEQRKLFSESDADAIIGYMTAKSEADKEYFHEYQLNEDGSLGNLFWADSMSRTDYRIFGDVLCFDTTYKTNAYRRPLVIFVGVNHHGKTTIFGFGLLVDETVETYCWITKTFLKAMHGKCPKSVVTDGNHAMRKAIKSEMAGSVHRLCSWHLQRNAQTNLGNSDFCGAFSHCMAAFMPETEFEMKWKASIEKFELHGNAWVRKMYAKCKQWAETFLRDSFFGRIQSTQRSESINAYMNRFLICRLKLYEFMRQIDRAMARLRHTKAKDDFETLNEHPVLVTHLPSYEKQASEVYTRGIFQWVHDEMKEETQLTVTNIGTKYGTYVPCRHTFGLLKAQSMINIPPSLLINRWTMNAKAAVDSEVPSDGTLDDIIKVARFGTLSVRCSRMCYFASDSTHGYEKAKMAIDSLCTEIQSLKASTSAGVGGTVPRPNDAHPIHIKNPAAATTKGSVRRTNKSGAQPRKCGRCRQPGHTAKSCQSNIHKGDSTGGSNEGMLTSGTTPSMGVDANTFEFPYNESSATNYARMTNDDVNYWNCHDPGPRPWQSCK